MRNVMQKRPEPLPDTFRVKIDGGSMPKIGTPVCVRSWAGFVGLGIVIEICEAARYYIARHVTELGEDAEV